MQADHHREVNRTAAPIVEIGDLNASGSDNQLAMYCNSAFFYTKVVL
jgi:hypothetical protein